MRQNWGVNIGFEEGSMPCQLCFTECLGNFCYTCLSTRQKEIVLCEMCRRYSLTQVCESCQETYAAMPSRICSRCHVGKKLQVGVMGRYQFMMDMTKSNATTSVCVDCARVTLPTETVTCRKCNKNGPLYKISYSGIVPYEKMRFYGGLCLKCNTERDNKKRQRYLRYREAHREKRRYEMWMDYD